MNEKVKLGYQTNIVDVCEWRQEHQEDRIAFDFVVGDELNGTKITYGELANNAKSVSVGLKPQVHKGSRVIVMLPPGLELVCALLGVFYSGGIAALIPPVASDKDRSFLDSIIKDMSPDAIITEEKYISKLSDFLEQRNFSSSVPIHTIEELYQTDGNLWEPLEDLQHAPCLIQYTSGSSGEPKGVVLSHHNIMHNSLVIQQSFFNTSKSYGVIWLPPYHDMGLIGGIMQPIFAGFTTTLMSPRTFLQKPVRWLKLISDKKATCSGGPNFAYDLCARTISESEKEMLDLSSWDVAFNGAEPVRASVINSFSKAFKVSKFKKKAFMPCYGLAESTLFVTANLKMDAPTILPTKRSALANNHFEIVTDAESEDFTNLVSCGLPYYNETIKIVNPEDLTVCRNNEIGEIWVSSESNALGYWNKEEQTKDTFHAELSTPDGNKYLRTGDLGFFHRSELFVTGRLKDLIIIRGVNHIPEELELTVQQSNTTLAVGKGVAIAVPTKTGEALVIINEVSKEARNGFDEEEVFASVQKALFEKHHINPAMIVLVKSGEIPKTRNGKLQRSNAQTLFLNNEFNELARWEGKEELSFVHVSEVAPEEQIDQNKPPIPLNLEENDPELLRENIINWMAKAIAREVSMDPSEIDPDMHFGLYGLDSVSAVSILVEFEKVFGDTDFGETLLWDYPNLNALTDYLMEILLTDQNVH